MLGMAEKGVAACDSTFLTFFPFDWINLGMQSVHATTKTSATSRVVQIPMKRPYQDTSALDMTSVILRVNQMRIAEAMHALRILLAFDCLKDSHHLHQSGRKHQRNPQLAH